MRSCLLIALAAGLVLSPAAHAESTVLVFDGSGSMWAELDGTPKIEIAKNAVGRALENWSDDVSLGLIAYGHREKANCDDIEMLVPVGPANAATVQAAVRGLDAAGKAPIAASVRKAAEAMVPMKDKRSIILVSDGLETCPDDPCAAAAELKAAERDLAVHVVAFGMPTEESRQLRCLSDQTGGRLVTAMSATELHDALVELQQMVEQPAKAGTIALVNAKGLAQIRDAAGRKVDTMCHGCGSKQLPIGIYSVSGAGFEMREVEVRAGEETIVDPSAMVGLISLKNVTGFAAIYDAAGKKVGTMCSGCGAKQLPIGTYRVSGAGFDLADVDIHAGEEAVVDPSALVGLISLKNVYGAARVYDDSGQEVDALCAGCGSKQLPVGHYSVKGPDFEFDSVEILPAKETVIDGAE